MISTLISTATSSNVASVSISSGIDSTYDHYMFVFTDINPATDGANFTFQVNATDGADYNDSTMITTVFRATKDEADASDGNISEVSGEDQADVASFQIIASSVGNGADESCAGIMHLYSPSSTTYDKHFQCRINEYQSGDSSQDYFVAGVINDTTAIDDIQFKMSSGNFDGVIQMYGIA